MSEQTRSPTGSDDPLGGMRKVRRWQVMRRLVSLYESPRYLEIGVCQGKTFDKVPATRKVAVDPAFRFDHEAKQQAHPEASYHPVPSDEYFGDHPGDEFDVIYLDGLHVYDQTLRDLLNALERLQPQGVIVIDDTRPPTAIAAMRDHHESYRERTRLGVTSKEWMGDVFKVVFFIQAFCPYLRYATIANNHGQTVVWRHARDEAPAFDLSDIVELTFEDFTANQDVMRLKPFSAIRRELREDLGL